MLKEKTIEIEVVYMSSRISKDNGYSKIHKKKKEDKEYIELSKQPITEQPYNTPCRLAVANC